MVAHQCVRVTQAWWVHTPSTAHLSTRKASISQHPRQVEYNIQDHEDVVSIVVVTGRYIDPASANKRTQYTRRQQEAGEGRRR
jgi:hypothetical protein